MTESVLDLTVFNIDTREPLMPELVRTPSATVPMVGDLLTGSGSATLFRIVQRVWVDVGPARTVQLHIYCKPIRSTYSPEELPQPLFYRDMDR